jgi:hypothetical protein
MPNERFGISTSRKMRRLLAVIISVSAGIALAAPKASAQSNDTLLYGASAYGTYATVGSVVSIGKTAPVSLSTACGTAQVGASKTGTSASVSDSPLATIGATNTSASSATDFSTSSSTIASVNLLAGLISADAVTSVSSTSVNSQGVFQESGAGSAFTNLLIAGLPYGSTPAPNTTISLLGFGSVVLNEQIISHNSTSAHITVNMIDVTISLPNILGIAVGTKLIVADAYSSLYEVTGPAALGGEAYGTMISGQLISSSATAPAIEPCSGTGGSTITKTLTGINIPPSVSSGTITDTAEGTVTSGLANGETTDTIEGINLLLGVVTADVVQATATGSTTNGSTFDFTGSGTFTNIQVAGNPQINDNVPENTKVSLAGFGTLWLYRVIRTADSIETRMLEIEINQTNILGLPIGADIRVGDASLSLHSANTP